MGTKSSGGSCQPVIILSALTVNGFFHFVNRVQAFDSFQKLVSVLCKKVRLCVIGKNHAFCRDDFSIFNSNLNNIWTFFLEVDPLLGSSEINTVHKTLLFFLFLRSLRLRILLRNFRFLIFLGTFRFFIFLRLFGLCLLLWGLNLAIGTASTGTASIRGIARNGGECSADTGNALTAFRAGKSFSGFIHYFAIGKVASIFVYRISILG